MSVSGHLLILLIPVISLCGEITWQEESKTGAGINTRSMSE